MQTRQVLTAAGVGLVAGAGAYFIFNRYFGRSLTPGVKEQLPIAKDLKTVSDEEGNFDIDGVSYDIEGVIISGDAVKTVFIPLHA